MKLENGKIRLLRSSGDYEKFIETFPDDPTSETLSGKWEDIKNFGPGTNLLLFTKKNNVCLEFEFIIGDTLARYNISHGKELFLPNKGDMRNHEQEE